MPVFPIDPSNTLKSACVHCFSLLLFWVVATRFISRSSGNDEAPATIGSAGARFGISAIVAAHDLSFLGNSANVASGCSLDNARYRTRHRHNAG